MRIFLMRNLNKHCYFLQFHRSSILNNNSCRQFCIFLLENGKTKNLQIQLEQQLNYSSAFSTFRRLNQTPHIEELLKQRTKRNFSIAKFSSGKEHSDKPITLGIETLGYVGKTQMIVLVIRMRHDRENGNKWIHLSQKFPFANNDFPNIPLPKDAYLWIKGMDSLIKRLADYEDKHPICEALIKGGHSYEYKFEIGPNKKDGKLTFTMKTIAKNTQKRVAEMSLPIQLLPLVRDRMAKMLTEFDGTQKITPSSTQIPNWMSEEVTIKNAENADKLNEESFYRDTSDYKVDDEPMYRKIKIQYQRGASGREFIQILQRYEKKLEIKNDAGDKYEYFYFTNIPIHIVPRLLNSMEIMANDLQKQPQIDQNQSSLICHQLVKGIDFNYKMEIHSTENKQMDFRMKAFPDDDDEKLDTQKLIELRGPVPIDVFHWLREQMAEILLVSSSSSSSAESNYQNNEILDVKKLQYLKRHQGKFNTMFVCIEMHQSKDAKKSKSIYLYQWLHFTPHKFARIFVPEDAYSLIKAMDELMSKIIELDKPPNSPIFAKDREGLKYDYRIGIRPNEYGHLEFTMESITVEKNPSHKPKFLFWPIRMLPLLRDGIAKMLTEFDGTQQIETSPSTLPKWMPEEEEINSNNMANAKEENKEKSEILPKETLNNNVNFNTIIGNQNNQIIIRLEPNKRGEYFIRIVEKFDKQLESTNIEEDKSIIVPFPPIPVKIASHLLKAMRTLSNDLEKRCTGLQISDEILAKLDRRNLNKLEKKLENCQQIVSGNRCDYKLWFNISHISKQLVFRLQTITIEVHPLQKTRKLYGPISINMFNMLMEQMAELLKSYSTSNQQNRHHIEQLESDENGYVDGKHPIIYEEEANNGMHERLIRIEQKDSRVDIEPGNTPDYEGNDSRNEVNR